MLALAAPAFGASPPTGPIASDLAGLAAPGDSFETLYGRLQRASTPEAAHPYGAQFASWEMAEWPGALPPRRRAVRHQEQPPATIHERGRELVLLGLAWLGRLAR